MIIFFMSKDPTATTEMTTVCKYAHCLSYVLVFCLLSFRVQIHLEIDFLFFGDTSSAQPSVQRHSNPTIQPTSNHNISTNTSADPHGVTTALPTDINSSPDLTINSSTLQSITTDVDDSSSPPTRISNHHSSDTFYITTQSINVSKIFTNITNNTISSTRINPNRYSEQTPSTEDVTDNPTPDASTASARGNGRTTSSIYIYNEKSTYSDKLYYLGLLIIPFFILACVYLYKFKHNRNKVERNEENDMHVMEMFDDDSLEVYPGTNSSAEVYV